MVEHQNILTELDRSNKSVNDILGKLNSEDVQAFLKINSSSSEHPELLCFLDEIKSETEWVSFVMGRIVASDMDSNNYYRYSTDKVSRLIKKIAILKILLNDLVEYIASPESDEDASYIREDLQILMTNVMNCIYGIKFDELFTDNFHVQNGSVQNYADAVKNLVTIYECKGEIESSMKEANTLLQKMKQVEKATLKIGLAGAYKKRMDSLWWRILGLDIINYFSLFSIFIITLSIFINIDRIVEIFELNDHFLGVFNFNTISVYERFILVMPFVFLSWFASKRSQFLYQIREEYSYKYATALAYEGYKTEMEKNDRTDKDMQNRLMEVTIDNLSRSPLEQFDKNSDHSPYLQVIKQLRLNSGPSGKSES